MKRYGHFQGAYRMSYGNFSILKEQNKNLIYHLLPEIHLDQIHFQEELVNFPGCMEAMEKKTKNKYK